VAFQSAVLVDHLFKPVGLTFKQRQTNGFGVYICGLFKAIAGLTPWGALWT